MAEPTSPTIPALSLPKVASFDRPAQGTAIAVRGRREDPAGKNTRPPKTDWPAARSADVEPGAQSEGERGARAGDLPIWIGSPAAKTRTASGAKGRLHVQTHERGLSLRAGIDGPLVSVRRTEATADNGQVAMTLGYSDFADSYGGGYGARLRLTRLPACVLSTPERSECRTATPLPSRNDVADQTVTAQLSLASAAGGEAVVLAATAAPSSSQGDYAATSLSASATWTGGGNSGGSPGPTRCVSHPYLGT